MDGVEGFFGEGCGNGRTIILGERAQENKVPQDVFGHINADVMAGKEIVDGSCDQAHARVCCTRVQDTLRQTGRSREAPPTGQGRVRRRS